MKGLAIYSLILIAWGAIANFIDVIAPAQNADVQTSAWAVALYAPIIVFFVMYFRGMKK